MAIAEFFETLYANANWWAELRNENDDYKKLVTIKKIDYPLTFGLDVIQFRGSGGSIYVRFYPLLESREKAKTLKPGEKLKPGENDKPIVEIRDDNKIWYPFYAEQFERHWRRASLWEVLPGDKRT